MKILDFLKTKKQTNQISQKYELSESGYKQLSNEDETLYLLSRAFVLDYAQNWDKENQKQEAMSEVLKYVGLPHYNNVENKKLKTKKREFKHALRSIKNTDLKMHVVQVANTLFFYKNSTNKQ